MNPYTGSFHEVTADRPVDLDEVLIIGQLAQIEELSRRVKLGAAEIEKRKARRKAQGDSRKKNR